VGKEKALVLGRTNWAKGTKLITGETVKGEEWE
jgi:hypothetical protein